MSDATTTMAAALGSAQERKAKKSAQAPKKTAREREFQAAVQRNRENNVITLEGVRLMTPSATLAGNFERILNITVADYDETFGAGYNATMDEMKAMATVLAYEWRGETEYRNLEMHMQRVVGARIASAHGAARFYQSKAAVSLELNSALRNPDRDEDRMGVDGQENRAQNARLFAAQAGARAYALLALAEGAAKAYAEFLGSEWQPYSPRNSRTLDERANAEALDALGF